MNIAAIVPDSIVDGPGLRLTVFTQGCPHACPGCHNPETHDPQGGEIYAPSAIIARMDARFAGLTLSGGEPFLQPQACRVLAEAAKARGQTVWIYSGYPYEQILSAGRPDWLALLDLCDVLVDGPFVQDKQCYGLAFRGSSNQRLIDLGKSRTEGRVVLWSPPEDGLAHLVVPET